MPTRWRNTRRWLFIALFAVATLPAALGLAALPAAQAAPATNPAALSCSNIVANGDFEATGGWTLDPGPLPPQMSTVTFRSGTRSLLLGNAAGPNVAGSSSARQAVTIPPDATSAVLTFWYYPFVEPAPGADTFQFSVLTADGASLLAGPFQLNLTTTGWNQALFDFSAWRGQSFQIAFTVNNDGGAGGRTAVFLDDVWLVACVPAPGTATPSPSPTPTGCAELVQNGSFDNALAFWESVDAPGAGIAIDRFVSPPYSLQLGSLEQNFNGLQTARQQIALPLAAGIKANVWVYTQSQTGAGADYQEIRVLNSSGVTQFTPMPPAQRNDNAWQLIQFDLTSLAGQTIYLRFGVNNDGAGGRTAMYVDDVSVTACGSGPAPTAWPTAWPTAAPTAWPTPFPTGNPPPPPPPPPSSGCVDQLYNGSFDAGFAGWVVGKNMLPAMIVSAPVFSPPYSAMMGTVGQNLNSFSSIRQTVTIPPGAGRTLIGFWEYTTAESLTGADRQQFVLLGPGNVVWATPWKVLEDQQGWQQHLYELLGAPSSTFDVYFGAVNDGLDGRTALYVDNVHVWTCPFGALPATEAMGAEQAFQAQALPGEPIPSEPGISAQIVPLTPPASDFAAPLETQPQPLMVQPGVEPQIMVAPEATISLQPTVSPAQIGTPQVVPLAAGATGARGIAPQAAQTAIDVSGLPTPGWTQVAIAGQATSTPELAVVVVVTATPAPPESRLIATSVPINPDAALTAAAAAVATVAPSPNKLPFGLLAGISARTAQWPIPWPWVLLIIAVVAAVIIWLIIANNRRDTI